MEPDPNGDERPLLSRRTLDLAVGIAFLIATAIMLYDSNRIGFSWRPNEGPAPGYFPFYIAIAMLIASLINLFNALRDRAGKDDVMVTVEGFTRMSAIFGPALLYVLAINFIGIYLASALYICGFMIFVGKFSLLRAVLVGFGIALASFVMFEIWFLVPLPKGPLEAALGY